MGYWLENETHDINWVTCSGISGAYSLQMQIRLTRASTEWLKHGEQPHWVHSCISCKSWGTASNETLDLLKKFHVEQIICHSPSLAFSQKNKKMDPLSGLIDGFYSWFPEPDNLLHSLDSSGLQVKIDLRAKLKSFQIFSSVR